MEAITFARVRGWKTEKVVEIAVKISQLPKASETRKRITVIIQGSLIVVSEDGKLQLFSHFPMKMVKLLKTDGASSKIFDTDEAANAFVGGFLSQLVKEKPIEDCVKAGCYAANVIIQSSGCTYPKKPDFK